MYAQSTTNGKVWKISTYRNSSGQINTFASEGELTEHCFSTMLYQDRTVRTLLNAKRLTAKVEQEGNANMLAKLIEEGKATMEVEPMK